MNIRPITSLAEPDLEPYVTLRENTRNWRQGVFVAEGEKVVLRLLESSIPIISLLMSPSWWEILEPRLRSRCADADVFIAPPDVIDTIVGLRMHKRILAIARIPENAPLTNLPPVEAPSRPRLHVAVEGIADAENMGTIIRNCAAFGASTLIVGPDSSPPYLRRSVRVSMGTIFSLPVHGCGNLVDLLLQLHEYPGWRIIGTTPRDGTPCIREEAASDVCLVFGSEGLGLTEEALAACHERFTIPMHLGVDSINVANALAVTLYEFRRAR